MATTETRKITVELPADMLETAMRYTGEGVTKTLYQVVEAYNRSHAYQEFRKLRGCLKGVDHGIDVDELRQDRD